MHVITQPKNSQQKPGFHYPYKTNIENKNTYSHSYVRAPYSRFANHDQRNVSFHPVPTKLKQKVFDPPKIDSKQFVPSKVIK